MLPLPVACLPTAGDVGGDGRWLPAFTRARMVASYYRVAALRGDIADVAEVVGEEVARIASNEVSFGGFPCIDYSAGRGERYVHESILGVRDWYEPIIGNKGQSSDDTHECQHARPMLLLPIPLLFVHHENLLVMSSFEVTVRLTHPFAVTSFEGAAVRRMRHIYLWHSATSEHLQIKLFSSM